MTDLFKKAGEALEAVQQSHGASELANALFNGQAFVLYGHPRETYQWANEQTQSIAPQVQEHADQQQHVNEGIER